MENLIAPEMAIIMRFKKPFAVAGEQAASQPGRQQDSRLGSQTGVISLQS